MKKQYDGEEAPSGSRFGCESYTCPKCNGRGKVWPPLVNTPKICTNCNGEGVVAD